MIGWSNAGMSDEFLDAMSGVQPLQKTEYAEFKKQMLDTKTVAARRQAAQSFSSSHHSSPDSDLKVNVLTGDQHTVEPVAPLALLSFQRPGVQHGVFKKLRLGKYTVEAHLDLHRMTVEQARMAVIQFVRNCLSQDIRCALINHGKGEGRQQPAVLKSCIAYWLPQLEEILAFHSAQQHQGGLGATYIMLKKSDSKRQDNLERHQRRLK